MKKIDFKFRKAIMGLVLAGGVGVFISCEPEPKNELDGKGPNILRADAGPDKLVVAPTTTSTVTLATIYKDANSAAALNQTVSASFSVDPQIVLDRNAANPDDIQYAPLDAQYFSFSPAALEFGPGEWIKELKMDMKAAGLDLSKDYAIGLVTTATGYTAGGDKFIKVALPSAYEGQYKSTGKRYNYNAASDADQSTNPPSGTLVSVQSWTFDPTTASTLSSKTVAIHAGNSDGGFGRINVTVNPSNNTVTLVPNADCTLNALVLSTHYPSTYDPATKTLDLWYEYTNTSGTFRIIHDKLVHK
ncbi:MAG: DUF1735 domain-containing protein [Bacteroidetes bacterium]|nr:DUF1735 domain-containing protein [Bacteroidota bacterium]